MAPNSDERGTGLSAAQLWHHYRRYPYLLAKVCLGILILAGLLFVMRSIESVLFPMLASLLIAYLLDPAVDWFEQRKVSRSLTIVMFLFAGLVGVALFALVLYPTIARTIGSVIDRLPELAEILQTRTLPWLREQGVEVPPTLSEAFAEHGETLKENLPSLAQKLTSWVGGVVTGAGSVVASLLNIVMIPLFTFYFLRDFDRYTAGAKEYLPVARRDVLLDRIAKADEVVGAWFRGQVEVAAILAGLYGVGLGALFGFLGIGTMSGVAIGILTGLLNIVPYFGVLIGIVLSGLLVLIDWHGWAGPLGVAAVFGVVQFLEGYFITPKIVGEKVGLSEFTVIVVLLLGGEIGGLMGVLLAIPVTGVVRVLIPDIVEAYKRSAFFTGELPYDLGSPPSGSQGDGGGDVAVRPVETLATQGNEPSAPDADEHATASERETPPATSDTPAGGAPEDHTSGSKSPPTDEAIDVASGAPTTAEAAMEPDPKNPRPAPKNATAEDGRD